ncbi:MAG TPA: hypothetical protein IAB48_01355 [Candidatus Fimimorpha excrementavium]|nr:hypothetical protein [Candidatus Fimimorpha excrementavium]
MKIWFPPQTDQKSRYAFHALAGIAMILLLALFLILLTAYMTLFSEAYQAAVSLIFCMLSVFLILFFSLKLGQRLERSHRVPDTATEIVTIDALKEYRDYYSLVCQTRIQGRQPETHTYLLMKGYEDESSLFLLLERKRVWEHTARLKKNRNPFGILISLLVLIAFALLCLGSHPYFGTLPREIYFPSLFFAMISLSVMVYFIIRQRRGE